MAKPAVNYGVYLVTDSTPAILGDGDICAVVEAALRGGVTVVQYRDKHSERSVAVETARRLHGIAQRFGVPLLINDRVDVPSRWAARACTLARTTWTSQTSLTHRTTAYVEARNLLGPGKIIGVTASSKEEALRACEAGADYLGLGTVYATQTKKDTKSIIGPSGVRDILAALAAAARAHTLRPSAKQQSHLIAAAAGLRRWYSVSKDDLVPGSRLWKFDELKTQVEENQGNKENNIVIVDVREPVELFETGKIPGAINIPITTAVQSFHISKSDFEELYGYERPEKDVELLFYCKAGVRARAAAALAKNAGWKNVGEYPGSWLDWEAQKGPVEKI
ncbi:hypothetical protein G7Z17_g7481 [Cylindrodendrum hubeiense]|uniref:Rhodanese domain-containing protein n=1 Tax=Cylindrodendrum hubeiense TaxID=595255 RepID=A0A9P5H2X4_9HYPO|nr:hypothetical protein G7Z17_g7481 [Cylindrodendrum hubeiense]